jgi:hypothetical protein
MATKIQLRRDTTTNWTTSNPVLSAGEIGVDLTTGQIKIGNGTSTWNQLSYYAGGNIDLTDYATESYVNEAVAAIVIPDVSNFITAEDVPTDISELNDSTGLLTGITGPQGEPGPQGETGPAGADGSSFNQDLNTTNSVTFADITVTGSAGIENADGARITNSYYQGTLLVGSNLTQTPVSILMGGAGPRNEWKFTPDSNLTLPEGGDILDSQGNSVLADTGNIEFRNDSMNNLNGIYITNADQTTASTASITIPANDAASAISIANNNNNWSFGNDGKFTTPGNLEIYEANGGINYITSDSSNGLNIVSKGLAQLKTTWDSTGYTIPDFYTDPVSLRTITSADIFGFNVEVTGQDYGARVWTFGPEGKLKLPNGGDIVNSAGVSVLGGANLGNFKIEGNTLGTAAESGGWGAYDMNLSPNGESYAWIYIPNNESSANSPLILGNGNNSGVGVHITAGGLNWEFKPNGALQLPAGADIVDTNGDSVLGGSNRVKLESPDERRIEEVYGYKEVSVTEVVLGTPVSATVVSSNTEYWQFYIYSSEELMNLYNSGSGAYVMEVSVDQNSWISAYVGGYNGVDALQIVLNNGATLQVYDNDTIYYRINTGGEPVVWWDKAELPGGGSGFRGAVIDYHAFTGESTIIGTIHIVDDDGEEHISHQEVQSGSSDGENDDLWLVTNEGQIQYRRIDKEEKTLKVQWSAKVFYGSELYD